MVLNLALAQLPLKDSRSCFPTGHDSGTRGTPSANYPVSRNLDNPPEIFYFICHFTSFNFNNVHNFNILPVVLVIVISILTALILCISNICKSKKYKIKNVMLQMN